MLKKFNLVFGATALLACVMSIPRYAQDTAAEAPAAEAAEAPEVDAAAAAEAAAEAEAAAAAKAAQRAVQNAFNEKFGQDEREVRRSRVTNDDAEFAQQLYTEGSSGQHSPELTVYLYEKAYAYGLRDSRGHQAANQSLDKLLELDETRVLDIGEMRLSLWEKWHETKPDVNVLDPEAFIDLTMSLSQQAADGGDMARALKILNRGNRFASRNDSPRKNDIRDSITDLVRTRKTLEEIAELEKQLGTDPAAGDKLAMVYLTKLDDPAKAATYADQMSDAAMVAKVKLAATEFEVATPAAASEAGVFYNSLVTKGDTREPVAMLIRARVWLTEYLSREQDEEDPDVVKAKKEANAMLGEVNEALLQRGIGRKLARKMSANIRGEGQFGRPADVQAAIDKAVAWLYTQHQEDRHWEKDPANHRNWGGYTALAVYALLMADEEPRVNGDLSRAVHFMMNTEMKGTYALCFRVHAWEVMPKRERYRQVLMKDVLRLRKGNEEGYWGYTMSGNDVQPGTRLDLSTTLAGGLGLWIGEAVGGITPKKAYWERIARGLIAVQLDDKGWSYNPATQKTSMGAMTAGSLALLYASYPHLNDTTKAKADEAIAKGLEWMDANFSETTNVNRGGRFNNYYFAAVQHAGLFSGKREFREMDWYESIKDNLLKRQAPNGAWGDVAETSFAIAFLCRGGIVYEPSASENEDLQSEEGSSGTLNEDAVEGVAPEAPAVPAEPADAQPAQ